MENTRKVKLLTIYILQILEKESDENHTFTHQQLIETLSSKYGLVVGRNAVGRALKDLEEIGYNIEHNKGVFLAERLLDKTEISFLSDLIYSSKSIAPNNASRLIKKLYETASFGEQKQLSNIVNSNQVSQIVRTNNKQVFFNIDIINEAIENKKQISFMYNEYDLNKNLVPRREKEFLVNPYFMVVDRGRYYLVGNYNKYFTLSNYRIEYITNIKLVDRAIKPITNLDGLADGLDKNKYINENIYMFSGYSIKIKIELKNPKFINEVIDWFGRDIIISKENEKVFVELTANENSFYYWALQYGEQIKVVEPKILKNRVVESLKKILSSYENNWEISCNA